MPDQVPSISSSSRNKSVKKGSTKYHWYYSIEAVSEYKGKVKSAIFQKYARTHTKQSKNIA